MSRFESLQEVMSEIFHVSPEAIKNDTTQEDIEKWDSVEHLNLMLALEDRFDVTMDVDDLINLTSVPVILEFLDSKCPSS